MRTDVLGAVCEWNEERDLTNFNFGLEYRMLKEELDEFVSAGTYETFYPVEVDQADALADIIFVAVGSLYKLTGGDSAKVEDILMAVTAANNLKGRNTKDGKITKPKDFVSPEKMIERILSE